MITLTSDYIKRLLLLLYYQMTKNVFQLIFSGDASVQKCSGQRHSVHVVLGPEVVLVYVGQVMKFRVDLQDRASPFRCHPHPGDHLYTLLSFLNNMRHFLTPFPFMFTYWILRWNRKKCLLKPNLSFSNITFHHQNL